MDRLQEYIDQTDANYRELVTHLDRLETNYRRTLDPSEENNLGVNSRPPRCSHFQHYYTESESDISIPHHRPHIARHTCRHKDTDTQYVKSVKVDAPSFDERLDPQVFIDWTLTMDRYFRWCDMSESRKV